MLGVEPFLWWYQDGWRQLLRRSRRFMQTVIAVFSVSTLLRTLFSPWRQIISYRDDSFGSGMRAALDNLISRFVGLSVRVIVLVAAAVIITLVGLGTLLVLIAWPLLPVAAVGLIVWGIVG